MRELDAAGFIEASIALAMFTENPKEVTHAVSVVPILAPIITPIALPKVRSPAFTKLTTIIVVADDD